MTKITITLQPLRGNQFVFSSGDMLIAISLGKGLKATDSYTVTLYDEQLTLLGEARTENNAIERNRRTLKVTFSGYNVWLPGNYFILLRNSTGNILRFNFQMDEDGRIAVEKPVSCPRMSDEDVLSGYLCNHIRYWTLLSRKPGARQFKRWVVNRVKRNLLNEVRQAHSLKKLEFCNNLLIDWNASGSSGHTVTLMCALAEVEGHFRTANCESFYDTTNSRDPYEELNELFDGAVSHDDIFSPEFSEVKRRIYKFSGISVLLETSGRVIMKKVLAHLRKPENTAVFSGTSQEIDTLLEQYPSLRCMFPAGNRLVLEPYTKQDLIYSFFQSAAQANLSFSPEASEKACRMLSDAYDNGVAGSWGADEISRYVEEHLKPLHARNAICAIGGGQEERLSVEVRPEDIDDSCFRRQDSPYSRAIEELQAMVGLGEIKQSIVTLSNRTRFFVERRQLGLSSTDHAVYHTILTGNPGTGKTTVARLLGRIYHSLGLLSKGEVVCVDRKRIIGRYIGDTEENMRMILREARGNVLFIDEAYTLYTAGDEKDFGRHAVECLLDVLSMKNPDMLVVFAGYQKEMDALMSVNQGLVGRFPYKFNFPDYTADELMQIAEGMLAADKYELTQEARALLLESICKAVGAQSERFANARWVEQFVCNGIIPALADRVSSTPHVLEPSVYQRIEASDVQNASGRFNACSIELRRHHAIGFCA